MNTVKATLEQVLSFRDRRSQIQIELLEHFGMPLVSFTMNIAGPYKRFPLAEYAFDRSLEDLGEILGTPVCFRELRCEAGCGAFLVFDRSAAELKKICLGIENESTAGRLLDLDVIGTDGMKLSRCEERHCLICGGPATPCARSRAHSLKELEAATMEILGAFAAEKTGKLAVRALLEELHFTPKPGLVDSDNCGAHRDMDLALMEKSAHSLEGYFSTALSFGLEGGKDLSGKLQEAGIAAEREMFSVTGGVNTHKGAVFSLGLLCAAVGEVLSGRTDDIFSAAAAIASELSVHTTGSHGEEAAKLYRSGGARSEAIRGFPHVRRALKELVNGEGKLEVLLGVISRLEDTNLLWRGGKEGLDYMQRAAKNILAAPASQREEMTRELDCRCIEKNLSPGGAADVFAAALFLSYIAAPEQHNR